MPRKWLGKEKLDEFVENENNYFCCFYCINDESNTSKIKSLKEKDKLDEEVYKSYKRYQKSTKSYFNQKDKIDDEDRDLKLQKSLKSNNKTKEFFCYACNCKTEFTKNMMPMFHPKFKVVICADCHEFIENDGQDYDPDEFCFLSGEGGELITCDLENCNKSWSLDVIKKWLGCKETNKLLDDEEEKFTCFCCDNGQGRCPKFLKQSEDIMSAFKREDIDEYIVEAPKKKSRKLQVNVRSTSRRLVNGHDNDNSSKRRSSRNSKVKTTAKRGSKRSSAAYISDESDEEIIEKRVTRDAILTNGHSYMEKSDDETDPEDILTDGEGQSSSKKPRFNQEPPTYEEQQEYFERYMLKVSKRYKNSEIYENLMAAINE